MIHYIYRSHLAAAHVHRIHRRGRQPSHSSANPIMLLGAMPIAVSLAMAHGTSIEVDVLKLSTLFILECAESMHPLLRDSYCQPLHQR